MDAMEIRWRHTLHDLPQRHGASRHRQRSAEQTHGGQSRQRPGAPASPEFVVGSYSSQLSARGETLQLRDGALTTSRLVSSYITPVAPTAPQQQLRITEVNYAPLPGDYVAGDYEFLELRNIGTTPLDLTGCNFTDGVNYTFGNIILQAGARLILAKNLTAFTSRYGTQLTVLGPFEGALNNAGDRIRIEDSVGEEILDFTYSPTWQPSTDEVGNSLVIRDESANFATWTQASAWTQSPDLHGSPGWADPASPTLAQPGALTMEPTSGGDHKINFKAIPGRPYLLEFSDDFENWQPLITLTTDVNGTAECIEPVAEARKFYRVRSP
jgi:Lamin Tail Domain